jgi:leucyl/phenylalanyl-tRNA--protein transferase
VLFPEEFRCTRSLAKTLRNGGFRLSVDRDFAGVIDGCAAPRPASPGTWITSEMRAAYLELHRLGCAHSVEAWHAQELVGGLYGVRLGGVFFGESMFSRARDASKAALAHLVALCQPNAIVAIDCQLPSRHLASLGARTIPRAQFRALLREHARGSCAPLLPP